MNATHIVFVYGTLRSGQPNHRYLTERPSWSCGSARTSRPLYEMRDCGFFPAVTDGGDQHIAGEVYRVDDETLARLDRLEGVPRHYHRKIVEVKLETGALVHAWIYLQRPEQVEDLPIIAGGDWLRREPAAV